MKAAVYGEWVGLDVVSRRLELLKLEGLGFSQAEIVKELSAKCGCSRRTMYNDFETRAGWQPVLQSVLDSERLLLMTFNRYEHVYRWTGVRLLTFSQEIAQLGVLNVMLKANALSQNLPEEQVPVREKVTNASTSPSSRIVSRRFA